VTTDAATGDRALDLAALADDQHRPLGQRRRTLDLDEQCLHEPAPVAQPGDRDVLGGSHDA
jgi:hypothetical protein